MKTIKSFLVLILIISPLLSCEEADELLAKDLDIPISFVVDINNTNVPDDPNEDADNRFRGYGEFSVLSNPDVAKNISKPERIKKLILNSVKYQYRNFSGNEDAFVNAALGFHKSGLDSPELFDTGSYNVAQVSLSGESIDIEDAQGFKMPLDSRGHFNVSYDGYSSANPLIFDTRLIITATVTVELRVSDL